MESKVNILAYTNNNAYSWKRYDTGEETVHQWDKYQYDIKRVYKYKNYATTTLKQDTECFLYHETKIINDAYACFEKVRPETISFNEYTRTVNNTLMMTKRTLPFDDFMDDNFLNAVLLIPSEISSQNDLAIGQRGIADIKYNWAKYAITSYKGYSPNLTMGQTINTVKREDMIGKAVGDEPSYYQMAYVPSEWNTQVCYCGEEITLFITDRDYSDWYPAGRTINERGLINIENDPEFNRNLGNIWNSLIEPQDRFTDNACIYFKAINEDRYLKSRIIGGNKGSFGYFGIAPNAAPTFIITSINDDRKVKVLMLYPVVYYVSSSNGENGYGLCEHNDRGLVISAMDSKIVKYSESPDPNYYNIGYVRGRVRSGKSNFSFGEECPDGWEEESLGIIAAGTLVPFIWHISFKIPYEKNFNILGTQYYRTKDIVIEEYPLLNVYFGYDLPNSDWFDGQPHSVELSPWEGKYDKVVHYFINEGYYDILTTTSDQTYPSHGINNTNKYYLGFNKNMAWIDWDNDNERYFREEDWHAFFEPSHIYGTSNAYILFSKNKLYRGFSVFESLDIGDPIIKNRVERVSDPEVDKYPHDDIYGGFYYKYIGRAKLKYAKKGYPTLVYSSNKNAYPLNGLQKIDNKYYWFEFNDREMKTIKTWARDELLGVVELTQSAGSADSFQIGTVGGATAKFEVLKPITDVLPFNGYMIEPSYCWEHDGIYIGEGVFTIKEITENGLNKTTVVAYDNVSKLDCLFKPLGDKLAYPITANRLFLTICAYCDIPFHVNNTFINDDAEIDKPFGDEKTTCREVMEWIAQIAAGIIVADSDGRLVIKQLHQPEKSRGSLASTTKTLDVSMLPIQTPNAIQYKYEDEVNLSYYRLLQNPIILDFTDNPFTQNEDQEKVKVWLYHVAMWLDALGNIYAFTVEVQNDKYEVSCGDSWVVSANGIQPRRGIIQNKHIGPTGMTLTSSGEIVSLYSEKALDDSDIEDIVDDVDRMFRIIRVNQFVLRDDIFGDVQNTFNDFVIFTPEQTYYDNGELAFDISAQFDDFYIGLESEIITVDGKTCRAKIEEGIMTIWVPMVPQSIVEIKDMRIWAAGELYAQLSNDDGKWWYHDGSSDEFNKYEFGNYDGFVYEFGNDNADFNYKYINMWTRHYPSESPYDTFEGNLGKMLYYLSDGEVHTFNGADEPELLCEWVNSWEPWDIKAQYNTTTRILDIWIEPNRLSSDITISAVNVVNSNDTFTLLDNEFQHVSLPITIPAGTVYEEMPTYWLSNDNDDNLIKISFNPSYQIDVNVYGSNSWYYYTPVHTSNKYAYDDKIVQFSNNVINITLGQKIPIVKEVIIMYKERGASYTKTILNGSIESYIPLGNGGLWGNTYTPWYWDGSTRYFIISKKYESNCQYIITYNKTNGLFEGYYKSLSTSRRSIDANDISYNWNTQTLTIDER